MGDRLASSTASGSRSWIIPDLHGNVAPQCTSAGVISDVFRYDAYGVQIGTSAGSGYDFVGGTNGTMLVPGD